MNTRQRLAEELGSRIPGCMVGTKFGHGSLHVGDKIFAFARPDESAPLKLPEARIAELISSGSEMHLLQMGARTMREWLVVPNIAATENLKLLREAMAYVASLPADAPKRAKKRATTKAGKKRLGVKTAATKKTAAKKKSTKR